LRLIVPQGADGRNSYGAEPAAIVYSSPST
jgi:hypothetical protein